MKKTGKKRTKVIQDPIQKELDSIKKLLILFLMKAGTSQGEIAKVLGVDQGNFSREFPARSIRGFGVHEKI